MFRTCSVCGVAEGGREGIYVVEVAVCVGVWVVIFVGRRDCTNVAILIGRIVDWYSRAWLGM